MISGINFIAEELISEDAWSEASKLTKEIDEDDTPFIALAIELKTKLWTGDKVLANGLTKKELT